MGFRERYKEWWNRQPKWFRWIINRLDDPFDAVKEWFYNEVELRGSSNGN